jgi:5-methylcytosine-specific restriction protein B
MKTSASPVFSLAGLRARRNARCANGWTPAKAPANFGAVSAAGRPNRAASPSLTQTYAGDLLRANEAAKAGEHLLLIDEINRADLARVLGEALVLFEVGAEARTIRLPHVVEGHAEDLGLSPNLYVLGTRNTADRTIARMDLAIRRRFAFVEVWPDLSAVEAEGIALAGELFSDTLHTFAEFADEDVLRLVPGHAYFLDPLPALGSEKRSDRVRARLRFELLPLLRDYVAERLCGGATEAVSGLADRVEARLLDRA